MPSRRRRGIRSAIFGRCSKRRVRLHRRSGWHRPARPRCPAPVASPGDLREQGHPGAQGVARRHPHRRAGGLDETSVRCWSVRSRRTARSRTSIRSRRRSARPRDFVWASSTSLKFSRLPRAMRLAGTTSQLWSVDVDGWPPSLADELVLPDDVASIADAPGESVVVGTTSNVIEKLDQQQLGHRGRGHLAALSRLIRPPTDRGVHNESCDAAPRRQQARANAPTRAVDFAEVDVAVGGLAAGLDLLLPSRCAGCAGASRRRAPRPRSVLACRAEIGHASPLAMAVARSRWRRNDARLRVVRL